MPVYLVSLEWLKEELGSRARVQPQRKAERPSSPGAEVSPAAPDLPHQPAAAGSESQQSQSHPPNGPAGVTQPGVEALVQQHGPDVGKTLLSLVYRIASLEQEVAALRSGLGGNPSPRPTVPATASPRKRHAALLEQLFRSNLALRQSIQEEDHKH